MYFVYIVHVLCWLCNSKEWARSKQHVMDSRSKSCWSTIAVVNMCSISPNYSWAALETSTSIEQRTERTPELAFERVEHELERHAELVEQQARHVHVDARAARQRHVAGGECALLERERVRCKTWEKPELNDTEVWNLAFRWSIGCVNENLLTAKENGVWY